MQKADLEKLGFSGFLSIEYLRNNLDQIPNLAGVYAIILPEGFKKNFLVKGSGGFFKGRDPNLNEGALEVEWVKQSNIIYFGKAGGSSSSATLRKRLKQYFDFGAGKAVGHYGGRLIWQIHNSEDLLVAWKAIPDEEPAVAETRLIQTFRNQFGQRPFANLKD